MVVRYYLTTPLYCLHRKLNLNEIRCVTFLTTVETVSDSNQVLDRKPLVTRYSVRYFQSDRLSYE